MATPFMVGSPTHVDAQINQTKRDLAEIEAITQIIDEEDRVKFTRAYMQMKVAFEDAGEVAGRLALAKMGMEQQLIALEEEKTDGSH
jgi:hypothetical protein